MYLLELQPYRQHVTIAWLIASWQGASGVSGLAPKSVMRYVCLGKDVFLICFSIFVLSLKALSKSIELAVANVAERSREIIPSTFFMRFQFYFKWLLDMQAKVRKVTLL